MTMLALIILASLMILDDVFSFTNSYHHNSISYNKPNHHNSILSYNKPTTLYATIVPDINPQVLLYHMYIKSPSDF